MVNNCSRNGLVAASFPPDAVLRCMPIEGHSVGRRSVEVFRSHHDHRVCSSRFRHRSAGLASRNGLLLS
jgi:hypothetical protein